MQQIKQILFKLLLLCLSIQVQASDNVERIPKIKPEDYRGLSLWSTKLEQYQQELTYVTELPLRKQGERKGILLSLGCKLIDDFERSHASNHSEAPNFRQYLVGKDFNNSINIICQRMFCLSEIHDDSLPRYATSLNEYICRPNGPIPTYYTMRINS